MKSRDEYVHKMQAKLDEWNTEIDRLSKLADKAAEDAKNEYKEQIETLKSRQEAASIRMEALKHAGESAWEDLKSGAEMAWTALGEAIDSARSRFR